MARRKLAVPLVQIFLLVMLAACSSDSSGTPRVADDNGGNTGNTIAGIAADGYLKGAKVCLDLNNNGRCDEGEPSAITGEGGAFTLELGAVDGSAYPVVVEVTTDTIDEDLAGTVANGYTLRAPAGKHEFVSPLTTLIQTRIDQNPALDAEAAAQIVGLQLNVEQPDKLFSDFVAGGTEDAELSGLYKGAQVVARAFGNIGVAVTDSTSALEGADQLRAVQVVTGKLLLSKLDQIAVAVQAGGAAFDPDAATAALAIDAEAGALSADEFTTVAAQIKAIGESVRNGAGAILPGKEIYSIEEDGDRMGETLVLFEQFIFGENEVSSADGYNLEITSLDDLGADDGDGLDGGDAGGGGDDGDGEDGEDGDDAAPFTIVDGELRFAAEDVGTATRFSSSVVVDLNGLTFKLDDLALTRMQDRGLRANTVTFGEGDVMYKIKATYQPTDIAAAAAMLIEEKTEEDPGYAEGNTVADLQAYVQTRNIDNPLYDHGLIVGEKTYLKYFDPATGALKGRWRYQTVPQGPFIDETITLGTYRIAALEGGDLAGRAYIVMDLHGFAEVSGVWDQLLLVNDAQNNHDFDEVLIAASGSKSAELRYFNRPAMEKVFAAINRQK
jgi:hypothetical protein